MSDELIPIKHNPSPYTPLLGNHRDKGGKFQSIGIVSYQLHGSQSALRHAEGQTPRNSALLVIVLGLIINY